MAASNDFKLYRYDPSAVASIIFIILFLSVSTLHAYQLIRTRTLFFIPFLIGGIFETVGYIARAVNAQQSPHWALGAYIMQSILILVAPALFAASIYMELGRIIMVTRGEEHAIIKQRWLTKVFVTGDVISFLMQGAGGGIMAGKSESSYNLGEKVILGGLGLQILFFGFFVVVALNFHTRIRRHPTTKILADIDVAGAYSRHLYALYGGSLLILVRSLMRIIEFAQGNDGYLISHEWFLYVFDALLMLCAMLLFAWVHPSELNVLLKGGGKAVRRGVSIYQMR